MADYTKQVIKILVDNKCYFVRRGKGSHNIWFSPILDRSFTVVSKIENRHTANGILKDAGVGTNI